MRSMLFGAASSPCSAQYVKNLNAQRYVNEAPDAVEVIVKHHYVDDMVKSFRDEKSAIDVSLKVKEIHAAGGFELRNFISNSSMV